MYLMSEKSSEHAGAVSLPEMLRPLFWDHDFDALSSETNTAFIVARILTSGSWEAVRWLRDHLGDDPLREWIVRREGRPLSPKQLRFWELILGLPHDQVNEWLRQEARLGWDARIHQ